MIDFAHLTTLFCSNWNCVCVIMYSPAEQDHTSLMCLNQLSADGQQEKWVWSLQDECEIREALCSTSHSLPWARWLGGGGVYHHLHLCRRFIKVTVLLPHSVYLPCWRPLSSLHVCKVKINWPNTSCRQRKTSHTWAVSLLRNNLYQSSIFCSPKAEQTMFRLMDSRFNFTSIRC